MKTRLASLLLLAAGLLAGPLAHALEQPAALLGAEDLKPLVGRSDVRLLDIRAPQDYAAGHVPGAVNTPYGQYRGPADNPGKLPTAKQLTQVLRRAGVTADQHVVVLHGGRNSNEFGEIGRAPSRERERS